MTRNQFYYTSQNGPDTGEVSSFNTDLVIRTMRVGKGITLVLLADGHEESYDEDTEEVKGKSAKPVKTRKRSWLQSQIYLNNEDAARLREALEVYPLKEVPPNTSFQARTRDHENLPAETAASLD